MNKFLLSYEKAVKNELYVIMHNGIIEKTNMDLSALNIHKNVSFTLIHQIDQDCTIDLLINPNCEVKIKELFYITNNVIVNKNIHVLSNSRLDIITLEHNTEVDIKINAKTIIENGSYISSMKLSLYLSNVVVNEDINVFGSKAHLDNYNVYINGSNSIQEMNSVVTHTNNDSESVMTNYGICKGSSTLHINTNGVIKKDAKRTNIRQKSKGILLDEYAVISANPWLQIDEFDCLASHGAGIGAIDEEELYYLMSRGLTRLESEKLIIGGFVNPIYENITNDKLRTLVIDLVDKYL